MNKLPTKSSNSPAGDFKQLPGWKLEEAKARFGELVRLARNHSPQLITVRGEDAVVVLAAEDFVKLLPLLQQPSLHGLLSESPLSRLELETDGEGMPVRNIEL